MIKFSKYVITLTFSGSYSDYHNKICDLNEFTQK